LVRLARPTCAPLPCATAVQGLPATPSSPAQEPSASAKLARGLAGLEICGVDLVEYCPPLDHADITGHLAAHLAWEALAAMAVTRR